MSRLPRRLLHRRPHRWPQILLALAAFLVVAACSDDDDDGFGPNTVVTAFALSPGNEVPPAAGASSAGTADVMLDPDTGFMRVSGTFAGLSSALHVIGESSMHVHRAAAAPFDQNNGGVVFPIMVLPSAGGLSGSFVQERSLTAGEVAAALNGEMYVNLHTTMFPSGEIRGQIEF